MNLLTRNGIQQGLRIPSGALYAAVVLVSAFVMLSRALPLQGTPFALIITVLVLFYLPGILLARFLGKLALAHPVQRFCWVLVSAFGITASLGALLRLLQVPVSGYILCLHLLMLFMALAPVKPPAAGPSWRLTFGNAPLYLLLAVSCVVVLYVALERGRFRFDGYEDQTVFAELADWLSHEPAEPGIRSRRIGVLTGDARWDMDGWTYTHAVWVWASGVPAAELIWFNLTPLFVWTVPLALFGMAYELTRREDAAAYAVALAVAFGLMTIDALVYYKTWLTFGQFALFQVNTLRTISTALVTPLALIPVFAYLHQPARRYLPLILLAGITVATMHPRQAVIYLYSVAATTLLWWLARPERKRFVRAAALAAVLVLVASVPLVQRLQRPSAGAETARRLAEVAGATDRDLEPPVQMSVTIPPPEAVSVPPPAVEDAVTETTGQGNPRGDLLALRLPVLGDSFIVDPRTVFYHPFVIIGVLAGLLIVVYWRRELAAQYVFALTAVTLILLFVPGISDVFIRLVTALVAPSVALGMPVSLALAYVLDLGLRRLASPRLVPAFRLFFVLFAVAVFALLLFEPIPIPASAKDQIRASNAMQALRDIQPADELLLQTLREVLPGDERSVLITPDHVAGYITESVPFAFVTGGRESSNLAAEGSRRFVNETSPQAPWLDRQDIEFIQTWGVTHVVLEIDNTRLTQLLLQPERFELQAAVGGYRVFRVLPGIEPTGVDALFGDMNALYQAQGASRWGRRGFALELPGTTEGWAAIAERWGQLGDTPIARLGLAFTEVMLGDDTRSLELWAELHEQYPQQPAFLEAVALTEAILGRLEQGVAMLLSALDAGEPAMRVAAARRLLTPTFFYLLNDEQLQQVIDIADMDSVTWEQLASRQNLDLLRQRIVLMLSRQRWDIAERWSQSIPQAEVDPRDLVIRALISLVRGDTESALRNLEPATDADQVAANRHLHPDRWGDNVAAQTYHILRGDLARREQRWADAIDAYNQAIAAGNRRAARYWLAETYREQGRQAEADDLLAALEAEWQSEYGSGFPALVSLLELQGSPLLHGVGTNIQVDDVTGKMTVEVVTGNLHIAPLPVRTLRIEVTDPAAATFYATAEEPVASLPGALIRSTVEVELPRDLPVLTPALVFVEPRFDNRVTFGKPVASIILNRPDDATLAEGAVAAGWRFGEHILLEHLHASADAEAVDLTLYWRTDAPLQTDYHVFTHVIDAEGRIVQQYDAAPADGRYPTGQWRVDTLIEDARSIRFETPLAPGTYRVLVGLYQPADGTRLPVTSADGSVNTDAFEALAFRVSGP